MAMILPTAKCFDDAIEFLEFLADECPAAVTESRDLWLVHAICRAHNEARTLYAHAWVEWSDQCFEAGMVGGKRLYYAIPQERYYKAHDVQQATAYNMKSVIRENERTNNYGPWQDEYLALCRTDGRVVVVDCVEGLFTQDTEAYRLPSRRSQAKA